MIDSLKLYDTLKSADLPDLQARAIAQAIESAFDDDEARQAKVLASKVDAAKLDTEVHLIETSLKQDISGLGVELRSEIRATASQLRSEFKSEFATVRAEFKSEFAAVRAEFKNDIAELRSEFKNDIAELRSEFKSDLAQLEGRLGTKIAESKFAMVLWMFVFWIGQVAAMKLLR